MKWFYAPDGHETFVPFDVKTQDLPEEVPSSTMNGKQKTMMKLNWIILSKSVFFIFSFLSLIQK